jgi:hypothetical protein
MARRVGSRQGGAYVVVLAVTMIVALMGLGSIIASRVRLRTAQIGNEAADARLIAQTGAEAARLWVSQDPDWRKNYPGTRFGLNQPFKLDGGSFTVELEDPLDNNLTNRPHDVAALTATGVRGGARQIVQVRLKAKPTPLPALAFALHAAGHVRVNSGNTISVATSAVSTNDNVQNDGTITGDVEIPGSAMSPQGTVTGSVRTLSKTKVFPPRSVIDLYAALGTTINPGTTIANRVIAPNYNVWPGGGSNPDGVYVIRSSSDMTFRDSRIEGTLVIICPGKTVTFEGHLLLHKAPRGDYPVLIIDGNAVFAYDSSTKLQETLLGTNYNPDGAPYPGADPDDLLGDLLDSYPSEIQGLVHVTGTVTFKNTAKIKGVVLAESPLTLEAVRFQGTNTIEYDKAIFANPPQGYTESVRMVVEPNSWKRIVR